jgi:hypothetical protein
MAFDTPTRVSDNSTIAPSPAKQQHAQDKQFDWTALDRLSPLAQPIAAHQTNCNAPLANYRSCDAFGLGSNLHACTCKRYATPLKLETFVFERRCNGSGATQRSEPRIRPHATSQGPNDGVLTPQQESKLVKHDSRK